MVKRGFSLIELLVVIALIGILTAILTFNFIEAQKRSRDTKRKSDLLTTKQALEMFYTAKSHYPNSLGNSASDILGGGVLEPAILFSSAAGGSCKPGFECLDTAGFMNFIPSDPNGSSSYKIYSECSIPAIIMPSTCTDIGKAYKIVATDPELLHGVTDANTAKDIAGEFYDPAKINRYQVSSSAKMATQNEN